MAIDPSIALGFRGVQAPDPLAQYGALTQIQSAQQANALRALQMEQLRQEADVQNRLRALDPNAPDYISRVTQLSPKTGAELELRNVQKTTAERQAEQAKAETLKSNLQFWQSKARDFSVNPTDDALKQLATDAVKLGVADMATATSQYQQMLSMPIEQRTSILSRLGASAAQPEKPAAPTELMRNYEYARGQGYKGTLFDYERDMKLAARPPAAPREPAAPTITQIQDPTNPSQMITIDARTYRGGGVGAPGVFGTTGKIPAVTAAEQKRDEGAKQAQDILDTLRAAYDELDRLRAIPSEQRNALSNAVSYIASTGVGQIAGRVGGTKEQTQRDVISSARNQMLNAIKNATGMSAQQLNSNVEFRSWLEALTDPTRSIEANREILDNMEKFIASGGKYSTKKGAPGAAATPSQVSNVAQERANANAAIAAGAPAAAVRARFKEKTGQEL